MQKSGFYKVLVS